MHGVRVSGRAHLDEHCQLPQVDLQSAVPAFTGYHGNRLTGRCSSPIGYWGGSDISTLGINYELTQIGLCFPSVSGSGLGCLLMQHF